MDNQLEYFFLSRLSVFSLLTIEKSILLLSSLFLKKRKVPLHSEDFIFDISLTL